MLLRWLVHMLRYHDYVEQLLACESNFTLPIAACGHPQNDQKGMFGTYTYPVSPLATLKLSLFQWYIIHGQSHMELMIAQGSCCQSQFFNHFCNCRLP